MKKKLPNTETRILKQAVKRNIERFPSDFMFTLSKTDISQMVSQNVIPSKSYFGGAKPFAFTEQGVTMLSSVFKNKIAIQVNISIIRVFTQMRKILATNKDIIIKLEELERKGIHRDKKK